LRLSEIINNNAECRNILDASERHAICLAMLRELPSWFGNEAAVLDYAQQCRALPFFAAFDGEQPVGMVALKPHNAFTSEICVMGVLPAYHRRGIGSALLAACEEHCKANGTQYLSVKTLADSHPSKSYAKTRAFYETAGFVPLEVFPLFWDADNPCLMMVKSL